MDEIKIGILGFGNVGTGVYKILKENGDKIGHNEGFHIKIEKVLVRDIHKTRNASLEPSVFTASIGEIIENPAISIVVELLGGVEPAREYILAALRNKKTVVTANKEVVAKHWDELVEEAKANGVGLYFEASVAGGIPVIKVLGESLQANKIQDVIGIINGTTNFILTKMSEEGRDFNDVLSEAQRLGYAEADPASDIEGFDAVYKLSILSSMAFHTRVNLEHIYREGICGITVEDINYGKELGLSIRLLAIAKKRANGIEVRVHPTFIPVTHPLAAVRDSYNAIFIKGNAIGNLMLYGRGAGDLPTGSAVVSDIITACHHRRRHFMMDFTLKSDSASDVQFIDNWETEYFVRLTVKDKPGVLAKIAGIFGKCGVSIASVIQKDRGKDSAPLIFVTHHAGALAMRKAIQEISQESDVLNVENVIHVER